MPRLLVGGLLGGRFLALAGLRHRYANADQRGLLCVAPTQGQLNLPDRTKIRGSMPKALWFQDARACHKFTIWNNKMIEWIICLEYLGIGDGFALNLF